MRFRKRTLPLSFRRDAGHVRALVQREQLWAARLEPALLAAAGAGYVDLLFGDGEDLCSIAMIEIDAEMIEQREYSPFIWPADVAAIVGHAQACAIEDELLPWIESLALTRTLWEEHIRFYTGCARDVFERARAAAFWGAAPYKDVFAKAAPYVYASRFAAGKTVAISDESGATGAALLEQHAATVHARVGDAADLARSWFALNIFNAPAVTADITIGDLRPGAVHVDLACPEKAAHCVAVATPVPMDIAVSFDREDAPPCSHFGVTVREPAPAGFTLVTTTAVGGSSGRIALAVREDAHTAPDADTDSAKHLAQRLCAEGFTADIVTAQSCDPLAYDLVHVLCAAYPEQALELMRRARSAGKPVVVTEPLALRDNEAAWGPATIPHILRGSKDEITLQDYLSMFAARRLEIPGIGQTAEPYGGYRDAQRRVLELAGARVAATAAAFLPQGDAADVRHLAGTTPYVLVHAPIAPRSNQFIALRAASAAGLRLVIAGPVGDFEYATRLKHYAGPGAAFVAEPADDAALMALYANARVFADPSWFALGAGRRALAVAAGCAAVSAPATDPADERAWTAALRAAWDAPRPAPRRPAGDPLPGIVQAYAAAQQSAVPV